MALVPVDYELVKPQTVYWSLPQEWCGPKKDYEYLGKPGLLPESLHKVASRTMQDFAKAVRRAEVFVSHKDRSTTWGKAHFQIYGVDELPKHLQSQNGHCFHYRKSVREVVLIKRSAAEREIEFQNFILGHEIGRGWGLERPEERDWEDLESIMVPGSWVSERGRPYVQTVTEADIEALRRVQRQSRRR